MFKNGQMVADDSEPSYDYGKGLEESRKKSDDARKPSEQLMSAVGLAKTALIVAFGVIAVMVFFYVIVSTKHMYDRGTAILSLLFVSYLLLFLAYKAASLKVKLFTLKMAVYCNISDKLDSIDEELKKSSVQPKA